MLQRLSLPHVPGPQNPTSPHIIPTTMLCPSSLPSPPTTIACIRGHASKVMFFFFFFFFFFFPVLERPLFPTLRVLNPPPLNHSSPPTPVLHPPTLASPAAAIACIRGHASKDMFFFSSFFFVSFLTNVTETLFT